MRFTEVIKVVDGRLSNLSAHIERMTATVRAFGGGYVDVSPIAEAIIPVDMRSGVVKCRIVYSDHILSIDFQPYIYRKIEKLALVEHDEIEYGYKFEDRTIFNTLLAQRGDADDILIVKNGLITDTSFTNVVFVCRKDRLLYTPNSYLLAGTKRDALLKNGTIFQRRIAVDQLSDYSEMFLINAIIDIEDQIKPSLCGLRP